MLIEYDETDAALTPYFDDIWGVIHGAWNDWNTLIPAEAKAAATLRSKASFIHDFMASRWRKLEQTLDGVRTESIKMMFVVTIRPPGFRGAICIRLKKMDEEGRSSNQQTQQVRDYRNQIKISELEADFHLEVGYVPDGLGLKAQAVYLVCPAGDGIYWKAEVTPQGSVQHLGNIFAENNNKTSGESDVYRKDRLDEGEESGDQQV